MRVGMQKRQSPALFLLFKLNISNYIVANSCTAHPHVDKDCKANNMENSIRPGLVYNFTKFLKVFTFEQHILLNSCSDFVLVKF